MKILVVVESINIEDSSGSKANVALINNLNKAGFEVLAYHYTLKDIKLEGIKTYAIPEIKISGLFFLSRLQRVISRNLKVNMASFLEKLFGFSFTFFNDTNSIRQAIEKNKFQPDLVLTLSKGASFRPHYAMLKIPDLHNKWIAYVHDPYPFHFYPRPYTWVEPNYKAKENFFLEVSKKAKFSAFPSQLLLEWMGSYFPDFMKTGIVIPHQNSKDISQNLDQNTNLLSYFDKTKFNLLHAGNLMKQRSPEGLIKGFKLFLEKNSDAKKEARLLLLGNASYHTEMLNDYKKNSPEIFIHNGNKPFDEVYYLQKNVSVNIILEAKGEISPFLPAKFPHCVEANKAILSLAPYYSETRRLLGEDYEYWSEVDDVKRIAFLIEKLYLLWKQNPNELNLNRKDLEEYVSVSYLTDTLKDLKSV
ncbi:UDP-glycosyltransferase [Flavobacterium sp. LC2016-01]|uniref:UDP-glycosyltransferase n=1 Tax=Flavobacterium sp. LC2016-01 TaxID=2675876 RepID=UPI0012BAB0E5|nr:UDP-glycosyltransferase [Flavobacterium sp. LC2016-01]MTH17544.1 UDP-glycosyltransferase [Flavobacterium sp. LC2016-01]